MVMDSTIDTAIINLKKSRLASLELNKRGYDLVMITEPYLSKSNVALLDRAAGDVYYALGKSPRACIRVNPDLNPWLVNEFTEKDICCIATEIKGRLVYVVSVYLDINLSATPQILRDLIDRCNQKGIPMILGMDSNAHSPMWGCDEVNPRGEELEILIAEKNLTVMNVGSVPTFKTERAESIIDVALINAYAYENLSLQDWRVDESTSFSDHRYVLFQWGGYTPNEQHFRNLKRADWRLFNYKTTVDDLPDIFDDGSNINECAKALHDLINMALDVACPMRKAIKKRPNSWWCSELASLREEVRHLENIKGHSSHHYNRYREKWSNYRRAIEKAKRDSWRSFCGKANSAREISKLMNTLKTKSLKGIGMIKRNGVYCETPKDSLEALMSEHFIESEEVESDGDERQERIAMHLNAIHDDDVMGFVTSDKVKKSLGSFGPNKSAGPDNFKPVVTQNLNEKAYEYIAKLYKLAIKTGYTPRIWRQMKVVFLPKDGKTDYGAPNSFRPITLSNFILKGLERILHWYIQDKIIKGPLKSQHAYTTGRSCDTALSEAVDTIEKAISRREKALVVSLDCSGAFNRIRFDPADAAMKRKGIPKSVRRWYINLLKSRTVEASLQGEKSMRRPTRGSPQGGVLSGLIWNLIMDELLESFSGKPVEAIGYADDVLLMIKGWNIGTMVDLMQKELDRVVEWGKNNGLVFNPEKTKVVTFTRSTKPESSKGLKMNGKAVPYSTSLKYLGITLTKRLLWTEHIKSKVMKGMQLLNLSKAVVGQNWGLSPDKILWIYTAMVRPLISYGSLVWGNSINKTTAKQLTRLQRQVMISMSNPLRSTPTDGMEVVLGLLPLDLHIEAEGIKARLRT